MKVYYKLPTGAPYDDTEAAKFFTNMMYVKWKYQIMWTLRRLETLIKKEGGMIILENINWKPKVRTSGFTATTGRKIREALKKFDDES